jgi:Tfp pilus assembly protein PilO
MHFSEEDLRRALKRKEPGEGFTQRVMARVNQPSLESKAEPVSRKVSGAFLAWWKLRPAWIVAVAAVLLLGFGWAGYQYAEYRHQQQVEITAAKHEKKELQEAERARDQAILALQIARSKLNHVLQQTQFPAEDLPAENRRQRL